MLDFPPTPEEGKCRRRGVLRPESVGRTRSRQTIIGCPRTGLARTIVAFSGGRTPITRHATPREHCAFPRGAARINALSLHRRLAKVAGGGALWGTRAGRRVRGRGNHKGPPALRVGQNPPPRPMGAWGPRRGWPPAKSHDTPNPPAKIPKREFRSFAGRVLPQANAKNAERPCHKPEKTTPTPLAMVAHKVLGTGRGCTLSACFCPSRAWSRACGPPN